MAYRKRDKPPFAAWLVHEREARGWKAEEVARRLREAGHQAEDSTYRTWESSAGRRPAPETVVALERLFGSPAPGADEQASGDLVAALSAQAAAIERLVDRIDALLASRDRDLEELARTLAALLASPATQPAAGGSRGAAQATTHPDR